MPFSQEQGTSRRWSDVIYVVLRAVAIGGALFHLIVLGVKPIDHLIFRSTHLLLAVLLLLSERQHDSKQSSTGNLRVVVNLVLILFSLVSWVYFIRHAEAVHFRAGMFPTTLDVIFGSLTMLVVLEITRRAGGTGMFVLAVIAFIYTMVGPYMPGLLHHRGYNFATVISFLYSPLGIYGSILGVAATYVILYVIFSAFLSASGAGKFFIDLSYALAGSLRGGPAKVAIAASALFGTINGSTTTNVLTTGTFTIPLMKRAGYEPKFAGAVEAVASCGGQLMPPIMGVAAFLIVENLGVPYTEVMKAALVPAIIYFTSLFFMVDFEAAKTNLARLESDERSSPRTVLREGWHLLLPLVLLIVSLVFFKVSPIRAAFWGIAGAIVASRFKKSTRIGIRHVLDALEEGMRSAVSVSAVCAGAGIIVGSLYLTGLGIKLSAILMEYSQGILPVALMMVMGMTILLGMGLPTVAAYGIPAAILVPALTKLGVAPLAAHMFIFYYSCISAITPPVALGAFVAAPLAGAHPSEVGWTATRIGLVGLLLPFMFIYSPGLLLNGSASQIVIAIATSVVGCISLAGGLIGWFVERLTVIERILLIGASILLIWQGLATDIIGVSLIGFVYAHRRYSASKGILLRHS